MQASEELQDLVERFKRDPPVHVETQVEPGFRDQLDSLAQRDPLHRPPSIRVPLESLSREC